jgi:hypothetical protein
VTPDFGHPKGTSLPNDTIEWRDGAGVLINFTTATWELIVVPAGSTTSAFAKTTGITGAATSPNVTIDWAASGEITTLAAGVYEVHLRATVAGEKRQCRTLLLEVTPSVFP